MLITFCRYVERNGASTDSILEAAVKAAENLSEGSVDKAAGEIEVPDADELMSADFIVTNSNGLKKIMEKLYEDDDADTQPDDDIKLATTLTASFMPTQTPIVTESSQTSLDQDQNNSDSGSSNPDVNVQSSTSSSSSTSSDSNNNTSGESQSSSGQCSADCSAIQKITGQSGGKQSSYGGGTPTKNKEVYSVCIKDHCIEEKTCNGQDCSESTNPACEVCSIIGLSDQFCSDCSNKRMEDVLEEVKSTCGCSSPGLG